MIIKNVSEAKAELSALLDAVSEGEEVIIGKAGVPVAKLIRFTGPSKPRVPGSMKGKIQMTKDFDELPKELRDAFGIDE